MLGKTFMSSEDTSYITHFVYIIIYLLPTSFRRQTAIKMMQSLVEIKLTFITV